MSESKATLDDILNVLEEINGGKDDTNKVHQKALEDLVSVNSLFTIAVFIGLTFASPNTESLDTRPECNADPGIAKRLVLYEVNSFALFLFSSLVAKSLKVALNIKKRNDRKFVSAEDDHWCLPDRLCRRMVSSREWRRVLLSLSIGASFAGIVLLTLSMVNVIQIRVGRLGCGSSYADNSAASLCVIVFAALVLYSPPMIYAVVVTADLGK